jgi:hypothetical protein
VVEVLELEASWPRDLGRTASHDSPQVSSTE